MTISETIAVAGTIILSLQAVVLLVIFALNARTKFPTSRAGGNPLPESLGLHCLNKPPKNTARHSISNDETMLYRKEKV